MSHGNDEFSVNEDAFAPFSMFRGEVVDAEYKSQLVPSYCHNPLIEALPKEYENDEQVARALMQRPVFSPEMRQLSNRDRIHCLGDVEDQFFQPLWYHLGLQLKISRMIRRGYVMRNPVTPGFYRHIQESMDLIPSFTQLRQGPQRPKALGFNLIGPSGIGKSYSLESILYLYPQVIRHRMYQDRRFTQRQLVWLKLDCPFDGSLKGLALSFFEAVDIVLGTSYKDAYTRSRKASIDDLLRAMARVAANHFLGVLVIDEIQVLRAMRGENSEKMLNFFVNLVNTIGVPVLLVGTDKARQLFESKPRQARRGTGQGAEVWYLMRNDDTWKLFLTALFKYQYIRQPITLTPELGMVFFEETQGITDLVVKLYVQSQIRAIRTAHETLTPAIIRSVALDSFQMLRPVITALHRGDKRALAELEDIYPFWREEYARLAQQEDQLPASVQATRTASEHKETSDHEISPNQQQLPMEEQQSAATMDNSSQTTRPSRRAKSKKYPAGSLRAVIETGKTQDVTPYQALRQGGFIFSFDTFLTDGIA